MKPGKVTSNVSTATDPTTSNNFVLENLSLRRKKNGRVNVTMANGVINHRCHVSTPTDSLSDTGFNQARRRLKEKLLFSDITKKAQITAYAKYGTNILVSLAPQYFLYDIQPDIYFELSV